MSYYAHIHSVTTIPCLLCLNDIFPISYRIATLVLRVLFLGGHEIAGLFGFLEHIPNLLEERWTNTFLTSLQSGQAHLKNTLRPRVIDGPYTWSIQGRYVAVSWLRNCSSCKASFISISMRIISSCFILRILKAKVVWLPSARLGISLGVSRAWSLLRPFIFNIGESESTTPRHRLSSFKASIKMSFSASCSWKTSGANRLRISDLLTKSDKKKALSFRWATIWWDFSYLPLSVILWITWIIVQIYTVGHWKSRK